MSVQERVKLFNQLNISITPRQSDKSVYIKQKNLNNILVEEMKMTKAISKKDITKIKKNSEEEKKDKNINSTKDNNNNIKKTYSIKETNTQQNTEIQKTMQEKMKSLELYFKLRNEGLAKFPADSSKSFDYYHNASINRLEKTNTLKLKAKLENETMVNLEIEQDVFGFDENKYKNRRYDKNNIENGKKFFKFRYINNKLKPYNFTIEKKQSNSSISEDQNTKEKDESSTQKGHDKERLLRKYNSDFILILEKSILSFNVKNFKESYEFLESSGIIKNEGEYGEFLLVVSGFDKFLVGEFLAKQKYPNDKKEVLNKFIESINMNQKNEIDEIKFIDCLRFLFSRLILPKDANLILEIMDKFSIHFFETNKEDPSFVETFKSSDKVYLLVSTILALNTMFTRTDIKIKNVIKKEEFIKMNIDISKDFIEKLYDKLKKNPIKMSDDYNESMYRKLAPLVKEDETGKPEMKKSKSSYIFNTEKRKNSGEDKNEEINLTTERLSKDKAIEEQIIEEDENDDDNSDDDKKGLDKKEFSLKNNLNHLTEEDKVLLKTPHKFYKITGSNKSAQREYILSNDLKKLYYDKKKKFIIIDNIIDVYNGINHSHNVNIKKYLKNNPKEEQFSGNFISLILDKEQIDLMSDDLESTLLWFKAFKSLILVEGNKRNKYSKSLKLEKDNKIKADEIWNNNEFYNKWNIYGKYLIMKLMERNRYILKEEKQNINKILSNKSISNFLKTIKIKYKKKELDYNEFFTLYNLGLTNQIRNKIWQILIGNPCGIFTNTYELVKKQIPPISFNDLDINNQKNKNFSQDSLSNKIINEIIKTKDLFITEELQKKFAQNILLTKVYNITRGFFVLRADIPFNKSIISIIFLFLIIFEDEINTFCNVVNVVCSNSLKIFIGDENEIKNYCSFFNYLLGKYLDKIEKHFNKLDIFPQLYLIPWFEELFTRTLNIKLLSHMFDLFLINGEIILFQISLAIIKSLEEELLNLTINEIFKALQRFPENASEADLFRKVEYYSLIKKEFFDWKLQDELAAQKSDLFKIILSE